MISIFDFAMILSPFMNRTLFVRQFVFLKNCRERNGYF
jgi:hypothetical protein